ncbi:MAG TPA: 50S ribosomal protein L6 [Longimicrobiales bacterium]|jgi:large subunit ribosomal protein L6|nr:50S ribosomal protein L6 [Longimicrobiales bacterium]
MSRIGKMPVVIPSGVTVDIEEGLVRVKGPRGELTQTLRPEVSLALEDGELTVTRESDAKPHRALHGLTRALVANMVRGVTEGFQKSLELQGVGYRAEKRGNTLVLTVGYSHPVEYPEPDGVSISTPAPTVIVVEGADKQRVGQAAAEIRQVRPPEPYKGKGIRYQGEHVRRKAGKTGV